MAKGRSLNEPQALVLMLRYFLEFGPKAQQFT
jgi:hypothetical protein